MYRHTCTDKGRHRVSLARVIHFRDPPHRVRSRRGLLRGLRAFDGKRVDGLHQRAECVVHEPVAGQRGLALELLAHHRNLKARPAAVAKRGRDVSSVGRIAGKGTVSRSGKESRRSGRDARRDVLSADVGDVDFRRLKRDAQKLLDFLHGRHDLSSALGGVAPVAVTTGFSFSKMKIHVRFGLGVPLGDARRGNPPRGQACLFAGSFRLAHDV